MHMHEFLNDHDQDQESQPVLGVQTTIQFTRSACLVLRTLYVRFACAYSHCRAQMTATAFATEHTRFIDRHKSLTAVHSYRTAIKSPACNLYVYMYVYLMPGRIEDVYCERMIFMRYTKSLNSSKLRLAARRCQHQSLLMLLLL